MALIPPTTAAGTSQQAAQTSAKSATDKAASSLDVNYDTFLQLLVAQMKNQDPTQPMDATEQVSQLATFSQVEQSIQTNRNLESLLSSSALSEADAVIGRTLTSADGTVKGVVKQVKLTSDGITATLDNGQDVPVGEGVILE